MRTIKFINTEIDRCRLQIQAASKMNCANKSVIVQGFEIQLVKLEQEHQTALNRIEVINPRIVSQNSFKNT